MTDDLLKRLRQSTGLNAVTQEPVQDKLKMAAADRIEELEAKLEKAVSFLDELRNEQCYDGYVLVELIKELTGGNDG